MARSKEEIFAHMRRMSTGEEYNEFVAKWEKREQEEQRIKEEKESRRSNVVYRLLGGNDVPLYEMELTQRVYLYLMSHGINSLSGILCMTDEERKQCRELGHRVYKEIVQKARYYLDRVR